MFLVPMINLYFIGFLENTLMTAGVGLAMTFVNILGLSVMVGINCAQETLTSQAFGANELVRCGVLLNRGRVILLLVFIPIAFIFMFTKQILIAIGQD